MVKNLIKKVIFQRKLYNNMIKENKQNKKLKTKKISVNKESFQRLKNLEIQRNWIKKAIMTIPYNASSIQLIKYLQESFQFDEEQTKLSNKLDINTDNSYNIIDSSCLLWDNYDKPIDNLVNKCLEDKKLSDMAKDLANNIRKYSEK